METEPSLSDTLTTTIGNLIGLAVIVTAFYWFAAWMAGEQAAGYAAAALVFFDLLIQRVGRILRRWREGLAADATD